MAGPSVAAAGGGRSQGRREARGRAALQDVALDPPPLLALHVPVGGAAVVRLARPDLAHQVEEHLRTRTTTSSAHAGQPSETSSLLSPHPHHHKRSAVLHFAKMLSANSEM